MSVPQPGAPTRPRAGHCLLIKGLGREQRGKGALKDELWGVMRRGRAPFSRHNVTSCTTAPIRARNQREILIPLQQAGKLTSKYGYKANTRLTLASGSSQRIQVSQILVSQLYAENGWKKNLVMNNVQQVKEVHKDQTFKMTILTWIFPVPDLENHVRENWQQQLRTHVSLATFHLSDGQRSPDTRWARRC